METKKCQYCGKEINRRATTCKYCGERQAYNKNNNSLLKTILAVGGILIILAALIALIYVYVDKFGKPLERETNKMVNLKNDNENFDNFISQFASNEDYQISHIKFPLTDYNSTEEWTRIPSNFFFSGKKTIKNKEYEGNYETYDDHVVYTVVGSDMSYALTFELNDNKEWELTDFVKVLKYDAPANQIVANVDANNDNKKSNKSSNSSSKSSSKKSDKKRNKRSSSSYQDYHYSYQGGESNISLKDFENVDDWAEYKDRMREEAKKHYNATYNLENRKILGKIPAMKCSNYKNGKIVVYIIVDPNGNVCRATIDKGTTIKDDNLRNCAIQAALDAQFDSIDEDINQEGTITYRL